MTKTFHCILIENNIFFILFLNVVWGGWCGVCCVMWLWCYYFTFKYAFVKLSGGDCVGDCDRVGDCGV